MGEWISLSNDTIEHICILFITKITRFIGRNRTKKSYHLLRPISRYSQFSLISMTTNLQVVLFNPLFSLSTWTEIHCYNNSGGSAKQCLREIGKKLVSHFVVCRIWKKINGNAISKWAARRGSIGFAWKSIRLNTSSLRMNGWRKQKWFE